MKKFKMKEQIKNEIKERLFHLFLSRRFQVFIIVLPLITILRIKNYISDEIFGNILIWLMGFILATNTIDKFKDQFPKIKGKL